MTKLQFARGLGACSRSSRCFGFILAAALLGLAGPAAAAPPAKGELPADLNLVPRDAACFVHIRAADIWNAPWMRDLRRIFDKAGPEAYKTFVSKFSPDPSTIGRLTLVMLTPGAVSNPFAGGEPEAVSSLLIVRTSKPYDRLRVMETLGQREKVYRRQLYYFNEDMWTGLLLIDDHTFVFGSEDALVQFVDRSRNRVAEGPLHSALVEAAGKHQALIAFNHRLLRKEAAIGFFPPPMQKLMEAESSTLTFDLQKDARLHLRLDYAKAEDAQAGEKALRDTLELGRQGLGMGIQFLDTQLKKKDEDKNGPLAEVTQGFGVMLALGALREMDTLLKEAKIERQGAVVNLPITYSGLESTHLGAVSLFGLATVGFSANRTFQVVGSELSVPDGKNPTEEHLKKLAAALEKYHQDKGAYPPSATYDKDGRPILSWRVALLPYLGEEALYKEFRLDEPWDSLHNKRLLKKLPKCFQAPNRDDYYGKGRFKTSDLVFTGPGTVFADKKGTRKADVGKETALVVEAGYENSVYWSKPADIVYAEDKPLPKLFGRYNNGTISVLQANGTFRALNQETDQQTLRAVIRRTGKAPSK